MLVFLPQSLGRLSNLKYLDVSKNNLKHLPGSMKNLRLILLDVSENKFQKTDLYFPCKMNVPSLLECGARAFLKTRCPYDASIIPFTLVRYLNEANYCVCGNACFQYYIRKFVEYNLNAIANSVKSSESSIVQFDCYFCTPRCESSYAKLHYYNIF